MKVDAIVIHFGDINSTKKCIKSLQKVQNSLRNIILVNNNPKVDLKKIFKEKNIQVLNSAKNTGFAKAVNKGAKSAISNGAECVLLLNNDAEIAGDAVLEISNLFTRKEIAIAAPVIMFRRKNKTFYDHGGNIKKYTGSTFHDNRKSLSEKKIIYPDFVSGCCMLIKRELFEKIGYFDERFFMYYEDVDFCIRTREKGYKIAVSPNSLVTHALNNEKSTSTFSQIIRSSKRFGKKYIKTFPLVFFVPIKQSTIFMFKNPRGAYTILRALLT